MHGTGTGSLVDVNFEKYSTKRLAFSVALRTATQAETEKSTSLPPVVRACVRARFVDALLP